MNKPKFLQRYLNKRREQKRRKIMAQPEYRLDELERKLKTQKQLMEDIDCKIGALNQERYNKMLKEVQEENKRTDPFKADKWKVVYDCNGRISTVYFNGQELYGVQRFDVDFDASLDGQTPRFTYEGYGSIEVITESE